MKLNLETKVAQQLLDRLKDEQPGTELAELKKQIERAIQPKAGQPLSSAELETVADTVEARIGVLSSSGHPTMEKEKAILWAALPKLELMAARQREREDDAAVSGTGVTW